ncbi:helix-turn-helix transcriptional regulator [Streptomyces sp. UNOC14_S4]|uniref:helix-turn-helix domain-containing protein n=1 Tax=Streptomyces sp. UNOC14_S4 TaxID=2872340 RepID=UPI0023B15383|nr:helix-turn-helix transcriptional regulator [Streptomyces sp. UNOC14_S4]MCC3766641.1 helix-turn-helix transcriptional regulator [Streptomyces sp. UNOC14_S4]
MPPRSTPTVRQQRLGAELRKMRVAAGVSPQEAAALMGVDRTRIPNIESGRFPISAERIRMLACNYGCTDAKLVEALSGIAQDRGPRWWDDYRGSLPASFHDIVELEHHAVSMRVFVMVHVPGLMQTAEYARAVFDKTLAAYPRREVELRAAHRMRRQEVLTVRGKPPLYTALVHEAALRMQFGGASVTRAQLARLLEMSEWPNVTLRAIPFEAEGFAGSGQPIFYAHGPVPQLDTVQLDSVDGSVFIDAELRLTNYRRMLDRTENEALTPAATRDLIHSIVKQL